MTRQILRRPAVWVLLAVAVLAALGLVYLRYGISGSKFPRIVDTAESRISIAYCGDNNPQRTLDLYQPQTTSARAPLVVFVHGGGWRYGHKNSPLLNLYGSDFINRGIAVADIAYRLNPPSPYPDENIDVACALNYLTAHATELELDIEKMVLFGDSAGGQLAAFAGLNIPFEGYDYEAPLGIIDLYGVSDFTRIINGKKPDLNARFYLGSRYNQLAKEASPTNYAAKSAPRFLFIHGNKDKVVPISQSLDFYRQLSAYGVDAEFVTIDGAGHAFNGLDLPPERYKQMRDSIDTFIKETLGR